MASVSKQAKTALSYTATGKAGATDTPITVGGGVTSGPPTGGAHVKGEFTLDDAGILYYCTVAGTPGTWVRSTNTISLVSFVIDGAGSVITTGAKKAYASLPFDCTFLKWRMLADVAGAAVLDIWKIAYASYPPTITNTITASAKPTISATTTKAESSSVSTWSGGTAQGTSGDVLEINVDSCSTITRLRLELTISAR